MKRSLVFTSVVLLSLAFVPSANAQSPGPFIGLWEGIDSENSASQHSITCSDDGTEATCQVTATFSRLTHFCRGGSAHGVGDGGVLEGDELHFVVLDARCENGNDADLETIYKHDLSNDTLVAMLFVNGGGPSSSTSTKSASSLGNPSISEERVRIPRCSAPLRPSA